MRIWERNVIFNDVKQDYYTNVKNIIIVRLYDVRQTEIHFHNLCSQCLPVNEAQRFRVHLRNYCNSKFAFACKMRNRNNAEVMVLTSKKYVENIEYRLHFN